MAFFKSVFAGAIALAAFCPKAFAQLPADYQAIPGTRPIQSARGSYFPIKKYTPAPIPRFADVKSALPIPIIEGKKEWLELYYKCWELYFLKLNAPKKGSPLVSNYVDDAFDQCIYQWDTHFINMFARYAHHIFPAIESHNNFFALQHNDGFICRRIDEFTGADVMQDGPENSINPPLFSWAEMESFSLTGDKSRFEMVLQPIDKYTEWLENNRLKKDSEHQLYWQQPYGSGMDNTPRSGTGWVDMSCQMVLLYRNMGEMCIALGKAKEAEAYQKRADEISAKINKWMWNEEQGLYFDVNNKGKQLGWKTPACFWPLLAGVASEAQAARLLSNLQNPLSFNRLLPFPTVAADEKFYDPKGDYWLGSVWAPTSYMIIKGLEKYGFTDFAYESSVKTIEAWYQVYKKTGTIWENYQSDAFAQGSDARKDFVGWSGLPPIALLIENVIGIRANAAKNTILWEVKRVDKHGIEQLPFGKNKVSLVYEPSEKGGAFINTLAKEPFTLVLVRNGSEQRILIKSGKQRFKL